MYTRSNRVRTSKEKDSTVQVEPFLFCNVVEMEGLKINNERFETLHCNVVEMEGIEPSSKQGSHTPSTCLFLPLIFVMQQDQDHQLHPYPLKFHWQHEAAVNYS